MSDNICVHCGADCGKHPVVWNNKKFCCNGCKTVYQLLNEKQLYSYYNIEKTPGIKIENQDFGNKYAYLDREDIQEKLILFREGDIVKVKFYIPVMHCASCVWLLEHLNTLNQGVQSSRVNFVKKEVSITFRIDQVSLRELVELMASIHYTPEVSLQTIQNDTRESSDKQLLYKIGVAGFAFGNVMLYSLPEYFNGGALQEDGLGPFLSILSYILTFPVVLFSGNDYIISAYKNIKKKVINIDIPIALGIITLFLVTSYQVIFEHTGGYSDSLTGLIFFLLLGKFYQGKTYQALSFERDYKSYFPVAVTKLSNSKEQSILLNEIEIGDVLLIRSKELIPADCILEEGTAQIDYSFVTGEAKPIQKHVGDFIYAGGRQTSGAIKIKVEKEVEQSHLTKLWNEDESNHSPKASLSSIVDSISEHFTVIVVLIALIGSLIWVYKGDIEEAIFVFTAVLIVACPCALALSIPFTFGNTMRLFGNAGLYIKNADVIEKLHHVNTIVFDKTGTLTTPDVDKLDFFGRLLTEKEEQAVLSLAKQSTHPLSAALAKYYQNLEYKSPNHFVEMSGRGTFGAVEGIDIRLGSAEFVGHHQAKNEQAKKSRVYVALDNQYAGYWEISNLYRTGFTDIMASLSKKFDLYLLSGDNDSEANFLKHHFKEGHLFFEQTPQDKKDFIVKLQQEGKIVLMTGDGLNDAGALMQADVALTIADDVYHFSPAGDAILEAAQFSNLSKFIDFTHTSLAIVKISFAISFFYNIIGISFALSGMLSPVIAAILMPISSVSVVAFATFVTRYLGRRIRKA
ncbi:MAG: heavy metal translocating P-type ATPase metal-binding domain-containing protein [Bacteroidales bacterium]|nr:heavy metal translocating P-type ATPase metal-binding domain-containing protein [Bacteroidales bacterium]